MLLMNYFFHDRIKNLHIEIIGKTLNILDILMSWFDSDRLIQIDRLRYVNIMSKVWLRISYWYEKWRDRELKNRSEYEPFDLIIKCIDVIGNLKSWLIIKMMSSTSQNTSIPHMLKFYFYFLKIDRYKKVDFLKMFFRIYHSTRFSRILCG